MAAYIIAEIEVTDPEAYEEYRRQVPPTITQYGGRYIVRGGAAENLEGDWQPKRIVVTEFASVTRAKEWLNSPEYGATKEIRHRAAESRMIVVEGVPS